MASSDFQVTGKNDKALFTLKLHRGDGMCLVAMNWKKGKPPKDFVGFAIESKPPDGDSVLPAEQPRSPFRASDGEVNPLQAVDARLADSEIPVGAFPTQRQSRRRVHVSRDADLHG